MHTLRWQGLTACRAVVPPIPSKARVCPCLRSAKRPGASQQGVFATAPCARRAPSSSCIRDVRAAAASGAAPVPAVPEGLFAKKIAALALIFLCGTVNYTILQSLRDAIIVTSCGAEALPFISAVGVLPASLVFFAYSCLFSLIRRVYWVVVVVVVVVFGGAVEQKNTRSLASFSTPPVIPFHFISTLIICARRTRSPRRGTSKNFGRCGARPQCMKIRFTLSYASPGQRRDWLCSAGLFAYGPCLAALHLQWGQLYAENLWLAQKEALLRKLPARGRRRPADEGAEQQVSYSTPAGGRLLAR